MKKKPVRLRTIFIFALVVTVVTVLAISLGTFLRQYRVTLIQNAKTSGRQTVNQVQHTVDEYLEDIHDIWDTLESELKKTPEDREEFFNAFLKIRMDVVAVTTYSKSGKLINLYTSGHTVRQQIDTNLSFDCSKTEAYAATGEMGYFSEPHVETFFEGEYPWVVTMVVPVRNSPNEVWAAVDIRCSNIADYINGIGIGQQGYCFLIDNDGAVVYHPKQQLIYSSLKNEDVELICSSKDGSYTEGNRIYSIATLNNNTWRAVGVTSVQEMITDNYQDMVSTLIIAVLVIVFATIVVSLVLSHELSRPIDRLTTAMRAFERNTEGFVYRPVQGVYEVSVLSRYFNHMVDRIKQLMEKVRSEETNLRKTELRALQAQINPHFLYNTLDSIALMCENGRAEDASKMVNSLARLFRISISKGHELIPIRDEVQHAKSYLEIQSVRYKNQFSYTFSVDEDCLEYLCNKITLQPIVENALYHGINGLVDEGKITVSVKSSGDDILLTVSDNGIGMDEEQIRSVLSRERSDSNGIGIKNVDDRLKIYFGQRYGVVINSVLDEGTDVLVRIPKIDKEAEYEIH